MTSVEALRKQISLFASQTVPALQAMPNGDLTSFQGFQHDLIEVVASIQRRLLRNDVPAALSVASSGWTRIREIMVERLDGRPEIEPDQLQRLLAAISPDMPKQQTEEIVKTVLDERFSAVAVALNGIMDVLRNASKVAPVVDSELKSHVSQNR